jgi:voltage-gated potassium channel
MAMRLKGSQLLTTVAGLIFVLVIAASLMFFAESNAQPDKFSSIPAAMWWSVVTLTTVGYGDTVPTTTMGRLLAAVIAVLVIGLFVLPAGLLSAGLLEADANDGVAGSAAGQRNTGSFCPHCGQPLTAGDADHRPGPG